MTSQNVHKYFATYDFMCASMSDIVRHEEDVSGRREAVKAIASVTSCTTV